MSLKSTDDTSFSQENDESIQHDDNRGSEEDDEEIDPNTLRIMISTDNHLGYLERDPVRGLDSFAAFEEVLSLARSSNCDMVLLAGDLFHENKPSRQTIWKTIDIIRRYCLGPEPVFFNILSDQKRNFRSLHGTVNYEDPNYSIDLPIFAIHGNHDDPTRDGGPDMLSALDLLAVSNLVNYFGTVEEVDNINIAPILFNKGTTNVALYGMGNLRDERLNRMWQGKKVRFLKPGASSAFKKSRHDQGEECDEQMNSQDFFNIFALHQNRDLGRGTKNCVHESMIPEWMDLVVWGHEHECSIDVTESLVGTFRITQPGSSVATSLVHGESVRKQVAVLDIRNQQFRLKPIPLTQVRAFSMGEILLQNENHLDPDDPKIDDKVSHFLSREVSSLVKDAINKSGTLREDAEEMISSLLNRNSLKKFPSPKYKLQHPDQVLVRLKVEHSQFTTLNNQRFGAQFVGQIANPSDILLFHRRRKIDSSKTETSKTSRKVNLDQPILPQDLAEMNIEDIINENLLQAEKKLEILDELKMSVAVDDFVSKEQRQAICETVSDILSKQQRKLAKRGVNNPCFDEGQHSAKENGVKITTLAGIREVCQAEAERARQKVAANIYKENGMQLLEEKNQLKTKDIVCENDGVDDDNDTEKKNNSTSQRFRPARSAATRSRRKNKYNYNDEGDYDSDVKILEEDEISDAEETESAVKSKRQQTSRCKKILESSKTVSGASTKSRVTSLRRSKRTHYGEDSDDENEEDDAYAETMKTWGPMNSTQSQKRKRR